MTRTRKSKSSGKSSGQPATAAPARKNMPNRLRIIGGRWRGVPVTFPPLPALRPSPDRVRETLFNWLQPVIVEARCLDLFAGSGVLGIEALSRGASYVEFVDSEPRVGRHLEDTLRRLQVTGLRAAQSAVHVAEALRFLEGPARTSFSIVFLDPPYASNLLQQVCERLAAGGWLASNAFIYIESPADQPLPGLPSAWSVHRTGRAGQVGYHLLRAFTNSRGPES
jgi:16S rRNA (guanine966-N2)-methyltransferase